MPENIPFDQFIAPAEPPEQTQKRLKGGQPGNLNALKHGLYIRGSYVNNITPVERASLCDFNDIIIHFKQYMEHLFTLGIASKDLSEANITLRSLSLAGVALTRLIHTQEHNHSFGIPGDWVGEDKESSFQRIYKGLLKSMSEYMDVSDLEAALNEKDLE